MSQACVPSDDPAEKLVILNTDTSQLIETIDYNLTPSEGALRFQRTAPNAWIAPTAISRVKQFLQRRRQAFR
jgi:hypothetical protein